MDSIVALPSSIVEWLSERESLSDIYFFTEFPPINKAVPLKKAIVAVGVQELKIVDKFTENSDGVLERQEYCRTADIHARLSICVPFSYGGSACHDIFTKVIDELTFNTDLNIIESECGDIQSDRNTSALVLTGGFRISADFCPAEENEDNYCTFLDKELLCGSHIRNDEIHVTSEEKEKWNSPFLTGYYFGNGSANRTMELGFKPKFLIVMRSDSEPVTVDFSVQKIYPQFAVSAGNYYTQGISVLANGFKIMRTNFDNSTAFLNEAGAVYCYVAMR